MMEGFLFRYLTELKVLRRDFAAGSSRERFHLAKFWRAEQMVEEAFRQLHLEVDRWKIELDFERSVGPPPMKKELLLAYYTITSSTGGILLYVGVIYFL